MKTPRFLCPTLAISGFSLALAAGCASPPEGEAADETPSFSALQEGVTQHEAGILDLTCSETNADRCAQCRAEAARQRSECFSTTTDILTSGGYSSPTSCERIGSDDHCDGTCSQPADECRGYEHTFVAQGQSNPDLLRACLAAKERDAACEETVIGPACETYALVENANAIEAYNCVADAGCEGDTDHCFDVVSQSDLGSQLQATCPEQYFSSSIIDTLNQLGGWLLDAPIDALMECSRLYCGTGEVEACASAWVSGVTRG